MNEKGGGSIVKPDGRLKRTLFLFFFFSFFFSFFLFSFFLFFRLFSFLRLCSSSLLLELEESSLDSSDATFSSSRGRFDVDMLLRPGKPTSIYESDTAIAQ